MMNTTNTFPQITALLNACQHLSDLRLGPDSKIYFQASHDGIGTLYQQSSDTQTPKDISSPHNVRGTVGYGGGGFDLCNGRIAFCEKKGSIYILDPQNDETLMGIDTGFSHISSPRISPNGKWVVFIFEQDEINGIAISPISKNSQPRKLVTGADFYMQPAWHPRGKKIAWVEWDHPYMPWDASCVKMANLDGSPLTLTKELHIGGRYGHSANQPQFSPNGNFLSFIQRNSDWDDLILYDLHSGKTQAIVRGDGFHLRMPDWIQGLHSYRWSPDSQSIYFIKYHRGSASLSRVDIVSKKQMQIETEPYVWLSQLDISANGMQGAIIGQTASDCDEIVLIDLAKEKIRPIKVKQRMDEQTAPKMVTYAIHDGTSGYGWFYSAYKSQSGKIAPCIMKIHSGPTSLKHAGYSPETEFFRLHGFSVAHVNYRGSVSFGYTYQYALERQWGQAEVSDTLAMMNTLAEKGWVSRDRIAVMGSSAGGFSVLQLLIQHPGLFKAAICSYAVSDLVDDAENTHKFEKYYHRFLTGNYPEEKAHFIEHSPISHIDRIKDPVALFHGNEDPVVSVQQSRNIYVKLQKNGVPSALTIFDGEGHGFRRDENLEKYFQEIIAFLKTCI